MVYDLAYLQVSWELRWSPHSVLSNEQRFFNQFLTGTRRKPRQPCIISDGHPHNSVRTGKKAWRGFGFNSSRLEWVVGIHFTTQKDQVLQHQILKVCTCSRVGGVTNLKFDVQYWDLDRLRFGIEVVSASSSMNRGMTIGSSQVQERIGSRVSFWMDIPNSARIGKAWRGFGFNPRPAEQDSDDAPTELLRSLVAIRFFKKDEICFRS
jgi:hypothetical protein